jgi:hypothetical protein
MLFPGDKKPLIRCAHEPLWGALTRKSLTCYRDTRIIRFTRDPQRGAFAKKKPFIRFAHFGLYYFYPFQKRAFDGLKIIKPCRFTARLFLCRQEV